MSKQLFTLFERKTLNSRINSSNQVKSQFSKGTNCRAILRSCLPPPAPDEDCMTLMGIFLLPSFTLTGTDSFSQTALKCGIFLPQKSSRTYSRAQENVSKKPKPKPNPHKQENHTHTHHHYPHTHTQKFIPQKTNSRQSTTLRKTCNPQQ